MGLSMDRPTRRLRGGGMDFSMDELQKAMSDPEALEELKRLTSNPEAMAEVRAMMDDPEFRAQMTAMVDEGGAEKLALVKEQLASNDELGGAINEMGPSLGAALDLLKRSCEDAAALEAACSALLSLVRNLAQRPEEERYRTLRTGSPALRERLTRHAGGLLSLEAIGFRADQEELRAREGRRANAKEEGGEEEEEDLELRIGDEARGAAALRRAEQLIATAQREGRAASGLATEHELPFALCVALPSIRAVIGGDSELASGLTKLLLQNDEFRAVLSGPAAEVALPSILGMLRSQAGLRGVLEYFYPEVATPRGHRVRAVSTVGEWKAAVEAAGDRPLVALLGRADDPSSRMLVAVYNKLSTDPAYAPLDFAAVSVGGADDGMALRVLDEAFVHVNALPLFCFYDAGIEHRRWRLAGADVAELQRRLARVAAGLSQAEIDEGPAVEGE